MCNSAKSQSRGCAAPPPQDSRTHGNREWATFRDHKSATRPRPSPSPRHQASTVLQPSIAAVRNQRGSRESPFMPMVMDEADSAVASCIEVPQSREDRLLRPVRVSGRAIVHPYLDPSAVLPGRREEFARSFYWYFAGPVYPEPWRHTHAEPQSRRTYDPEMTPDLHRTRESPQHPP